MKPVEWLAGAWEAPMPFEDAWPLKALPDPLSRLDVLTVLVEVNGGFSVGGWGVQQSGGLFGRHGLEMGEAITLMRLVAFLEGMALGCDLEHEMREVVELVKAKIASLTAAGQAAWRDGAGG